MKTKVTVLHIEEYDDKWPSESLREFGDWIDGQFDSIPEEHRGSAKIELSSISGYEGDSEPSIEIYYYREETKEESEEREGKENHRVNRLQDREKRELKRLQDKYGDES